MRDAIGFLNVHACDHVAAVRRRHQEADSFDQIQRMLWHLQMVREGFNAAATELHELQQLQSPIPWRYYLKVGLKEWLGLPRLLVGIWRRAQPSAST